MISESLPHGPHLCLPPASAVVSVLNAAFVGAVASSVLRFNAAAVTVGTAITVTNDADDGTIFAVTERGMYIAELVGFFNDSTTETAYGISKNADATTLIVAPNNLNVGMLEAVEVTPDSAEEALLKLCIPVSVSSAEASAAGGCLVRFHATDAAGAAPSGLVVAGVRAQLYRVADYIG